MQNNDQLSILKRGTKLHGGDYEIIKILGRGGFGITYLAKQQMLNKTFAIKEFFIRDLCGRDDNAKVYTLTQSDMVGRYRQKFIKEAQMMAKLDHPGIVKVTSVFEENGTVYYVMEHINGESLRDILEKNGPLPEKKAMYYINKVAEALDYLHKSHVNHLDLKPANIMIREEDDTPILIDFGVSKQYDEKKNETSTTPPGVSAGYSPLEQYQAGGVSTFSPQADVYALGATLYKLLTGDTPPDASVILNTGLPHLPNTITPNVRKAIGKAMQSRVADRFESVNEFIAMIRRGEEYITDEKTEQRRAGQGKTVYIRPKEKRMSQIPSKQTNYFKWIGLIMGGIALIALFFLIQLKQKEEADQKLAEEKQRTELAQKEAEKARREAEEEAARREEAEEAAKRAEEAKTVTTTATNSNDYTYENVQVAPEPTPPAGIRRGSVIREGGYTNVRQGPGTNYSVVTKIKDGSPIYYSEYDAKWCIIYNDNYKMIGYMHSSKVIR